MVKKQYVKNKSISHNSQNDDNSNNKFKVFKSNKLVIIVVQKLDSSVKLKKCFSPCTQSPHMRWPYDEAGASSCEGAMYPCYMHSTVQL